MSEFGMYAGGKRETARLAELDAVDLAAPIHGGLTPGWERNCSILSVGEMVVAQTFDGKEIQFPPADGEEWETGDKIDVQFELNDGYRLHILNNRYRVVEDGKSFIFTEYGKVEEFCKILEPAKLEVVDVRERKDNEEHSSGRQSAEICSSSNGRKDKPPAQGERGVSSRWRRFGGNVR